MHNKRFEFMEESRSGNDPEKLATIEKELIDIRAKLEKKALEYQN